MKKPRMSRTELASWCKNNKTNKFFFVYIRYWEYMLNNQQVSYQFEQLLSSLSLPKKKTPSSIIYYCWIRSAKKYAIKVWIIHYLSVLFSLIKTSRHFNCNIFSFVSIQWMNLVSRCHVIGLTFARVLLLFRFVDFVSLFNGHLKFKYLM